MYRELHPGTSADTAAVMVTCAADALYLVLEHVGLLGHVLDGRLARYESDGLTVAGWRAETTINEPNPLRPGPD